MTTAADLVEAFDPAVAIEHAWTPPSGWYTSEAIWELERRFVFPQAWHPAALTSALETSGRFVAGCHVGEPWVISRDETGTLTAMSNTCRHKGREVVVGEGSGQRLVCGYHGWAYDLRGRLKSAPKTAGIADFDRDALALPRLALDQWGPWMLVSHDTDASPMAEGVPELDAALRRSNWAGLQFVARKSWTIACNWKVYVDNYLDGGYHIPHMHPSLDAQLDMDSYRTELFERCSIQTSAAAVQPDARTQVDASARIGDGAIYAWIYPNLMINRYGPCMDTNLVIPLGPNRCRVDYEFFFMPAEGKAGRAFVEQSIAQADVTQHEDIEICESVQRGLGSAHYDRGRYAPRVEIGEHHFHQLLAAQLRRALST